MKISINKTIVAAAALLSFGFTSCVKDLDVENINPQQTSTVSEDDLINKIYASFSLTGTEGPAGHGDIADVDEGRSDYFRTKFYLNEFTSDEAHWVWFTDTGIEELLHNSWGANCVFSAAMYARLYFTITLCNEYLSQSYSAADQKQRNAEVRFIRALNYLEVLDLYGGGAWTETVDHEGSGMKPEFYDAEKMFNYVEQQLKLAEADLADPKSVSYGRIDKMAAWILLGRLYLNAEVYTGKARWDDALSYAKKAYENENYKLNTTGAKNPKTGEEYSAYQMLFLADNDRNGAQMENVIVGLFDGIKTKSYGGTNFLIQASYSNKDTVMNKRIPSGLNNNWGKCLRLRSSLVNKFFQTTTAPNAETVKEMTSAAGDDRALFYGKGLNNGIEEETTEEKWGFNCVKFRNVNSDGSENDVIDFCNTDLPVMRYAEAYLTLAEAYARKGDLGAAKPYIDAIRDRAHATKKASYDLDDICDEWAREFWWEGRRRTDLRRFGKYENQSKYTWEWKGGVLEGNLIYKYRGIFPFPVNECSNNKNIKQNDGY